ncbi:MAG TPA: 3',5'-cyclic-nucleotide phosphodiesterase [Burkholderiales bacterium]|nr:3',5'-cyclic-nucleotide phosphodiesterase [Burkholderiales bacterium]
MKLRVLGCSGGIGGRHLRTTSMLLDNDVLIDAGTGVADLSLTEMSLIDHVFLTHSHLDHIASIPFMVDTVGGMREKPLTIWALQATIGIIQNHIFNWSIWPDFTQIPLPEKPFIQYKPIQVGQTIELGSRRVTVLPANHVVPAVGYQLDSGRASLVFTGDTTTNDPLWKIVNRIPNLKHLIIETAFCNRERELAIVSKHLCPSMLAEELAKLERTVEIYITHLKPGEIELTMQEIEDDAGQYRPRMLQNNQVFEL